MYRDLLISDRIRQSSRGDKRLYEEVESDRARVLYSAAFRRLQRKTQVFPLDDNAAIRTRLTHSLEVAHVGRYLASSVIAKLSDSGQLKEFGLEEERAHAFIVTVEVACLLHDIGNPPFGHFGEVAIGRWCEENLKGKDALPDLNNFDGNPQGFRIVTRLAGADSDTGMNLTLTQLASTLKYQSLAKEKKRFSKFGVFDSEEASLSRIREKFGLKPEQRFCIAYLMEAADDISYCLSDLEDGVEKGLLSYRQFIDALEESATPDALEIVAIGREAADKAPEVEPLVAFRSGVIRHLVSAAAERYISDHASILAGAPKELLSNRSKEGEFLAAVKSYVKKTVYDDRVILKLEVGGLSVVRGLLDCFRPVLEIPGNDVQAILAGERVKGRDVERRLLLLVAGRHKNAYVRACEVSPRHEVGHRARMIIDYVSGMTDSFALESYQKLSGSRV